MDLTALLFFAGVVIVVVAVASRFRRTVDPGKAMIVETLGRAPKVTFTGVLVLPLIHRAELIDLSVKIIEIDRRGKDSLICRDDVRADITVTFYLRVNRTSEDVLEVARSLGCARAGDQGTIEELFAEKCWEAIETAGKGYDFEWLYVNRPYLGSLVIAGLEHQLNGFVLDDAAIDYFERTPTEALAEA